MPESKNRGALTEAVYYIMLSLYTPLHGYGIIKNVSELSNERVVLGPGTLYGALNTLAEKEWIILCDKNGNSRKKEYMITEKGKAVVAEEILRLQELLKNGISVTGGDEVE